MRCLHIIEGLWSNPESMARLFDDCALKYNLESKVYKGNRKEYYNLQSIIHNVMQFDDIIAIFKLFPNVINSVYLELFLQKNRIKSLNIECSINMSSSICLEYLSNLYIPLFDNFEKLLTNVDILVIHDVVTHDVPTIMHNNIELMKPNSTNAFKVCIGLLILIDVALANQIAIFGTCNGAQYGYIHAGGHLAVNNKLIYGIQPKNISITHCICNSITIN